jgi:hypothetical protein
VLEPATSATCRCASIDETATARSQIDGPQDGPLLNGVFACPLHVVHGGHIPMDGFLPGGDLMFDFAQFCREFDLMAAWN